MNLPLGEQSHSRVCIINSLRTPRSGLCWTNFNTPSSLHLITMFSYVAGEVSDEVKDDPLYVPSIRFIGNTANGLGGAMNIDDARDLNLRGVSFKLNHAKLVGAVHVASTEYRLTEFRGCVFEGNLVAEGSAIYLATGSGEHRFATCIFRDNFAGNLLTP